MASLVVATILMSFLCASSAYDFYVGGRDGFVPNPKESLNNWAERMRFQVNDKLVFKYQQNDSVLVVKKEDYDSCNVKNPIQKLEGGNSVFQFSKSGPFYFISGVESNCKQGEKLIVVVLAPRNNKPNLPPPTSSPTSSPSPSKPPTSSPTPPSQSPSPSPSTDAPTLSPATPPTSRAPSSAPTPSPTTAPSASSPSPPSPSSPMVSPSPSPKPAGGNTPGAAPAPAPKASSSSVASVSRWSIGLVILVLGRVSLG